MIDRIHSLGHRLRWKYAKWRGERPMCEECGSPAMWHVTDAGYTCVMCEEQRSGRVAMLRDPQPDDYLND